MPYDFDIAAETARELTARVSACAVSKASAASSITMTIIITRPSGPGITRAS
jgi:hypothetical protein